MCFSDFNECECSCHDTSSGVISMHCMPCCTSCNICGKRIKYSFEEHYTKCIEDLFGRIEESMDRKLTDKEKEEILHLKNRF